MCNTLKFPWKNGKDILGSFPLLDEDAVSPKFVSCNIRLENLVYLPRKNLAELFCICTFSFFSSLSNYSMEHVFRSSLNRAEDTSQIVLKGEKREKVRLYCLKIMRHFWNYIKVQLRLIEQPQQSDCCLLLIEFYFFSPPEHWTLLFWV